MKNIDTLEICKQSLHNAFLGIDSLKIFYQSSIKNIESRRADIANKYKFALKIAEIFDLAFDSQVGKKTEYLTSKLAEVKLQNSYTLADFVEFEISEGEKGTKLAYGLKGEVSGNGYYDPKKAIGEQRKTAMNERILISSVLSSAVIIFETFLSKIYRLLVLKEPLKYFGGKTVEVAKILSGDLSTIISDFVDNEVTDKMYDSLDTVKKIEQKEELSFNKYNEYFEQFEEIYFRRNVYVHNEGYANSIYFSKVNERFTKNIKLGDRLVCDDIYINHMFDVMSIVIVSIYFEIICKMENNLTSFDFLALQAFDLLSNKDYTVAGHVYFELSKVQKVDFKHRLMYRINYINSMKQLGKKEIVQKELKLLDVSATTDDFKIAKLCLEDNFEEAYQLLKSTYPYSYDAETIRDWPIFINFRESEFYIKFVEEHSSDFNKHSYVEETGDTIINENAGQS